MKSFLIISALIFAGCDASVSGESTHTVQGEATVRVVVGVDATPCNALPEHERADCIRELIELAKILQQQQEAAE